MNKKYYTDTVPLLQGSGKKNEILAAVITAKRLLDILLSDRFCAAILAGRWLATIKMQVKLEA